MASLSDLQFGYHQRANGLHQLQASRGGTPVGGMQWYADSDPGIGIRRGEIASLAVHPSYQRQGIATAMLSHARDMSDDNPDIPYPQHSSSRSPAGSAFAARTGGKIPKNDEPQSPFSDSSTVSMLNSMWSQ